MKMFNVGKKPKKSEKCCDVESSGMNYPEIYSVNSDVFPPVKDMKVGQKCYLMVEAKPTRMTVEKDGKVNVTLQIEKMGKKGEKGKKVDMIMDKMYPKKKGKKNNPEEDY